MITFTGSQYVLRYKNKHTSIPRCDGKKQGGPHGNDAIYLRATPPFRHPYPAPRSTRSKLQNYQQRPCGGEIICLVERGTFYSRNIELVQSFDFNQRIERQKEADGGGTRAPPLGYSLVHVESASLDADALTRTTSWGQNKFS